MSVWVGISPLIGAGSLEGFAVGATVSGALFLAITAPRRLRRRRAVVASACGIPVSARSAAAGALGAESSHVEAFGAESEAEPVARPEPSAQSDATLASSAACDGRPADCDGRPAADSHPGAYRSRHRLADPSPGRAARSGAPAGRARRGIAFLPRALPGWGSRDDTQPDAPFPDVASSDVTFPDEGFHDGTFRSPRRPEARRLPRHAAPTVSFGTRVSGRVTGLFAGRPLAGGAPS
jgi:hypothetical protein